MRSDYPSADVNPGGGKDANLGVLIGSGFPAAPDFRVCANENAKIITDLTKDSDPDNFKVSIGFRQPIEKVNKC